MFLTSPYIDQGDYTSYAGLGPYEMFRDDSKQCEIITRER
jgi:hypothetical protein